MRDYSKVVYHETFGYAKLKEKLPITKQTIFEGASLSKSLFATFVDSDDLVTVDF